MPSIQNSNNFMSRSDEELQNLTVGELKPHNANITLVEYDPHWPNAFIKEANRVRSVLENKIIQLEHVGSTSVPGLCAKPIIDMLLVVEDSADEPSYVPALEAEGYTLQIREPEWFEHRMFKGPDTDINLHVFSSGTSEIDRMLRFRDWLRTNDADRDKYAQVKRNLAKNKWRHVQHYADAKTSIIQKIMERASLNLENGIPEKNLFMMCKALNSNAISELSDEYHVRTCRRDELDIWKEMPFDDVKSAKEYNGFMTEYFNDVYGSKEDLFFQKCLFVCDKNDTPIGTCFAWKAYEKISTIHWFKVRKNYEGSGIGRALLSIVMRSIKENDYPVFLHTQPSSFRAIKLYSDFGFAFLTDPIIGYRKNDLEECLTILKEHMPQKDFEKLQFAEAPEDFLKAVKSSKINQF